MIRFFLLVLLFVFVCSCQKTYNVKLKQSKYSIIKVKNVKEKCNMEEVAFDVKKDGVFIEKEEFTKLANNINKFNICYDNYFEKNKSNLEYYEGVIKTLGGEFVE